MEHLISDVPLGVFSRAPRRVTEQLGAEHQGTVRIAAMSFR
jgi:hypothetical protein